MSVTSEQAATAGDIALSAERTYEALSVHQIIRQHHDALIRFLRQRLRVKDDAADVAQETYIRMMQYEGAKHIASPSSMLFRVAINVANDPGRAEQVQRVSDQLPLDSVELPSQQPEAERKIAAEQDLQEGQCCAQTGEISAVALQPRSQSDRYWHGARPSSRWWGCAAVR